MDVRKSLISLIEGSQRFFRLVLRRLDVFSRRLGDQLSGLARQIVAFQNGFPSTIHLLGGELSLRRGVHEKLALFDKRVARCDRRYRLVRSLLLASTVQLQRDSARFFISILQLSFDILELRLNRGTLLIASISKGVGHHLIKLLDRLIQPL